MSTVCILQDSMPCAKTLIDRQLHNIMYNHALYCSNDYSSSTLATLSMGDCFSASTLISVSYIHTKFGQKPKIKFNCGAKKFQGGMPSEQCSDFENTPELLKKPRLL